MSKINEEKGCFLPQFFVNGRAILTTTVNNNQSINAYTRMGFSKKGGEITDIGGGFAMDDYRMVKLLTNTPCDATGNSPV